jgi:hypothetical protein
MSVDAADVQQRWKGVAKHFPLWRFLIDLFFDWGSYRMIGSDITTLVLQNKNVRRAASAMEGASDETLAALAGIAKINEARSNDVFRAVFLGYVSVPIVYFCGNWRAKQILWTIDLYRTGALQPLER